MDVQTHGTTLCHRHLTCPLKVRHRLKATPESPVKGLPFISDRGWEQVAHTNWLTPQHTLHHFRVWSVIQFMAFPRDGLWFKGRNAIQGRQSDWEKPKLEWKASHSHSTTKRRTRWNRCCTQQRRKRESESLVTPLNHRFNRPWRLPYIWNFITGENSFPCLPNPL